MRYLIFAITLWAVILTFILWMIPAHALDLNIFGVHIVVGEPEHHHHTTPSKRIKPIESPQSPTPSPKKQKQVKQFPPTPKTEELKPPPDPTPQSAPSSEGVVPTPIPPQPQYRQQ